MDATPEGNNVSVAGQTGTLSSQTSIPPTVATVSDTISNIQSFQLMSASEREELVRQQVLRVLHTVGPNPAITQHTHSHPHFYSTSSMDGTRPDETVLNMGDMMGEAAPVAPPQQEGGNTGGGQGTQTRRRRGASTPEGLQSIPHLVPLLRYFEGALPFLVLLFAKVMYNHRLGLLLFVAMIGTFYYANAKLKKLILLRDNQTGREAAGGFLWLFAFLTANIYVIYYFFNEHKLYHCLYFQDPEISELDIWTLLWVTVTTDFVVKFATVALKSVIAMLPKYILPYKKKGKYFLLFELVSQFYRSILPIKLWAVFMLEDKFGGQWVAVLLFLVYCIFKGLHLRKKINEVRHAINQCTLDSSVGYSATREERKAFDNTCPICHDIFTDPVKLSCKHVFCDDCICLWLDHEKTCPMCRAHIIDNPAWRDGSTSLVVQFF